MFFTSGIFTLCWFSTALRRPCRLHFGKIFGETSVQRKFLWLKIPFCENSVRPNFQKTKIPFGKNSVLRNSRANIYLTKTPSARILSAKNIIPVSFVVLLTIKNIKPVSLLTHLKYRKIKPVSSLS